ncbi:uncharacterized protein NPIL_433201 [Nephila pilipes]|uniref:Uncharacterized protein n=1 Tax=Nephila pilipes TaxID=299642 RepID=A0A8X6PYH2_NEPPI|nr:uncharacterized protein NPIL_433201 [Nephila pilipes]
MDPKNGTETWVLGELRSTTEQIQFMYYPDDNETSLWMYAMIIVGCAFVVFVAVTLYLMCHSTIRQVAEEDVKFRGPTPRAAYREYQRQIE